MNGGEDSLAYHNCFIERFRPRFGPSQAGNDNGPGFYHRPGRPAFALLRIEDYYKLVGEKRRSLLDIMDALPGGEFEFDPPQLDSMALKPAELD